MIDFLWKIFSDPKIFNYIIISLYACSAIRFAIANYWADMFYWLSALAITLTVTFGYKR